MTTPVNIPKRKAYKAADVCSMVELQPYVLRTWEAEFPDLGVPQSNGRTRLYRQADVDKVIRIKELIVGEGLTLGAARRKLANKLVGILHGCLTHGRRYDEDRAFPRLAEELAA